MPGVFPDPGQHHERKVPGARRRHPLHPRHNRVGRLQDVRELHGLLTSWRREIEALMPKPNPNCQPSPLESGVDPAEV